MRLMRPVLRVRCPHPLVAGFLIAVSIGSFLFGSELATIARMAHAPSLLHANHQGPLATQLLPWQSMIVRSGLGALPRSPHALRITPQRVAATQPSRWPAAVFSFSVHSTADHKATVEQD